MDWYKREWCTAIGAFEGWLVGMRFPHGGIAGYHFDVWFDILPACSICVHFCVHGTSMTLVVHFDYSASLRVLAFAYAYTQLDKHTRHSIVSYMLLHYLLLARYLITWSYPVYYALYANIVTRIELQETLFNFSIYSSTCFSIHPY